MQLQLVMVVLISEECLLPLALWWALSSAAVIEQSVPEEVGLLQLCINLQFSASNGDHGDGVVMVLDQSATALGKIC